MTTLRSDVVEEGYPRIKENVPGFTGIKNWQEETFDLGICWSKGISFFPILN